MARKIYQGSINDRAKKTATLIKAVGTVIKGKGYTGLTATNIALAAGVDRRLIGHYFGTVNHLIETYIQTKDYWVDASENVQEQLNEQSENSTRPILESLLIDQLDHLSSSVEMRKIVLWQMSENSEVMQQVCSEREKLSSLFFANSDKELSQNDNDLRAIAALLLGGIYSMVLHAKANNSLFCEIDLNTTEGMQRVKDAITKVLKWTYHQESTPVKQQ